jgi:O-antigen/teichoic acid export membrane protein
MGVSPLAAWIFTAPELKGLLLVAALGLPFDAVTVIPQASMRIRMQFRQIAMLGTTNVLATAILSVLFAFLQMGAYSLVLPRPIVSIGICLATFGASGMPVRLHFRMKLWKRFLRNARYFAVTGGLNTLLAQGDYLLTGLFFPRAILGAYYFAFNLSTQTVQLISANLAGVLLPSFAKIDSDRSRQLAAYLKVCSAIMLVGVMACLLQAVLAHPLLRLVYGHKWDAAIPLFQILSVGMIFILPSGPGIVMLSAQGRYRALAAWTGVTTLAFVLAVVAGALSGSVAGIAVAVACFFLVFGPLGVVVPVYESGRQATEFLGRVYFKPVLVGAIATVCGAMVGAGLYFLNTSLEVALMAMGVVLAGVYLVLLTTMLKRESNDLLLRLKPLFARYVPGRAGGKDRV